MERYDVAVIGAGLAGLQCADRLANRGVRVLLVDRKFSPFSVVQTTGIFVRRTLEDFNLPLSRISGWRRPPFKNAETCRL